MFNWQQFLNTCSTHSPETLWQGPEPSGSLPLLTSWCLQPGALTIPHLPDKIETGIPCFPKALPFPFFMTHAQHVRLVLSAAVLFSWAKQGLLLIHPMDFLSAAPGTSSPLIYAFLDSAHASKCFQSDTDDML